MVRLAGVVMGWILLMGASSPMQVEMHSDMLTVQVTGVALREVLEAIGKQANLKVIATGENGEDKIAEASVSDDFTSLPLEEGIARLLSGWNYALTKNRETQRPEELYIIARTEIGQPTKVEGLIELKDLKDVQELEVLRQGLRSMTAEVRLAALEIVFSQKVRDRAVLEEARYLSKSDPHPEVREKALEVVRRYGPIRTEPRESPDPRKE